LKCPKYRQNIKNTLEIMSNNQSQSEDVLASAMSSEKHPPPGEFSSSKAPEKVSEAATGQNQEAVPREKTPPILSLILIGAALWFSIFLITLVRPGSRNGSHPIPLGENIH
jgi:hypothetical protein